MRRKDELENQLVRARGTDFTNARVDVVSIGTIVSATNLDTKDLSNFTILGAWDSDPEKGIVSYLTPVAQSLLNRKVGEEVECEIEGVRHRHRIELITAYKSAAATETLPPPNELSAPIPSEANHAQS